MKAFLNPAALPVFAFSVGLAVDAFARHGAEVCPGLGRPFALMRDIRDKAHALVGHVPGVETKTDVAKCRVAIRTGGEK